MANKAEISVAKKESDGVTVTIGGSGEDLMFLLSFAISEITRRANIPLLTFLRELNTSALAVDMAITEYEKEKATEKEGE